MTQARFMTLVRAIAITVLAVPFCAAGSPAVTLGDEVPSAVRESEDVDQRRAEEIFATAEAAIWFPSRKQARWMDARTASAVATAEPDGDLRSLRDFDEGLERDFPRFREGEHGPWLLKRPATAERVDAMADGASAPVEALATVFSDSFESGMGNWTLENNTLDLYSWGATPCEAHTGTRAADAVRGGVNTLSCTDAYGPGVITTMTHKSCEGIAGAPQAWLDAWIHVKTETGYDTVGFYYDDGTGTGRGYAFSGTWNAWFHIILNLKQWYRVGDVTAQACPQISIQFSSDEDTAPGFGARIDDLTIGNAAPAFMTASIAATPASGAVPLTVSFTSSVPGASSSAAYLWTFGDAAASTAATRDASFTYSAPGDYIVRFRAMDGSTVAYAHKTIRATSGTPCSVSCTANAPLTAALNAAALFQATATATGCSGVPSYSWAFGDGKTSNQQNASHAYAAPGRYTWTLTASVGGTSCTKSGTITVGGSSARRRLVTKPADASLATGVIGAGGGTLSGGGLTITVPPGAFTASTTVTLGKAGTPRQEGDVSDTYAITGLPSKLNSSVTLEVEVGSASLGSNQKFYVTADASMYVKSRPAAEADVVTMLPIEATKSGTKVRVTIPPTWRMPAGQTAPPSIASDPVEPQIYNGEFRVKAERLTTYQTAHFIVRSYPSKSASATSILNVLESHYQTLTSLGFSLACRNDSGQFRRIPVVLAELGTGSDDPLGAHVSGGDPCGTNWLFSSDYLEITSSYAASDARVRAAAAHELFHLVQDMYSPGGARANLWLKEASSIWLENTLGLCPDVQNANTAFPWKGLFNADSSATESEAHHGYGASYAVKFRTDASAVTYDPFLFTLWEAIRTGNSEVGAFQAALGSSLPQYWKEFAKSYFFGTASGGCFPTWASFERQAVADEKALPKTTTIDAYPLSAKSWNIDLQKFKSAAATPVTVDAAGLITDQSVFIYDVKAKTELAELTKASPKYEIDDLNKLTGTVLVLVFVDMNVPGGSSASTNKVTLNFGSALFRCYARFFVQTFTEVYEGGANAVCTGNCLVYNGSVSSLFLGSIQGDKFHSDKMWCPDPPGFCRWREDGARYTNRLDFDFTANRATIANFRLNESLLTDYSSTPSTASIEATVAIPKISFDATGFQYKVTGAGLCSSIKYSQGPRPVKDVICDSASYFQVTCEALSPPSKP